MLTTNTSDIVGIEKKLCHRLTKVKYTSCEVRKANQTSTCFQGIFQLRVLNPRTLVLWIIVPPSGADGCDELHPPHFSALVRCRKAFDCVRMCEGCGSH